MKTDLIVTYKKRGQPPLSLIQDIKQRHINLRQVPIGYAGRLDPMAEGLVLLLLNEKNKERAKYEKIRKVYEAEVLFGVETDTFDALGMAQAANTVTISSESLTHALRQLIGVQTHPYPPFSSPRVNGKPLWLWAKEGKISEIKIPHKQIEIYRAELNNLRLKEKKVLKMEIFQKIAEVIGDFRQEEIQTSWNHFFMASPNSFQIATITFDVSSGTYIRSLAHNLGKAQNTGAIAFSIKRTKLGGVTEHSKKEINFVTEEDLFKG
jgi:tRNA pseudouridine55 synthase